MIFFFNTLTSPFSTLCVSTHFQDLSHKQHNKQPLLMLLPFLRHLFSILTGIFLFLRSTSVLLVLTIVRPLVFFLHSVPSAFSSLPKKIMYYSFAFISSVIFLIKRLTKDLVCFSPYRNDEHNYENLPFPSYTTMKKYIKKCSLQEYNQFC